MPLVTVINVHLCFVAFQELEEIRKCGMKNFRNIQVDEANLLTWQGLIVPVSIKCFIYDILLDLVHLGMTCIGKDLLQICALRGPYVIVAA